MSFDCSEHGQPPPPSTTRYSTRVAARDVSRADGRGGPGASRLEDAKRPVGRDFRLVRRTCRVELTGQPTRRREPHRIVLYLVPNAVLPHVTGFASREPRPSRSFA